MALSKGGYVDGGSDLLKAPDAPTITSVTPGIGTVSVAFTAPSNPGGSAVTGYTVTAIDESTGASVGATGSGSPINVSLSSGTFKVRAAATNIYGPGRVSAFDTGNVVEFSNSSLYGTGDNSDGQLGDGTVIDRSSPVQVGAPANWAQVSAGGNTTAAVKTDGTLWAWGANNYGQLGQNNKISRSSPVQIGALTNWAQVSSANSDNLQAIKTDGTLWGIGDNRVGQLGDETVVNRSSPVQVGSLADWSKVSSGGSFTVAIKTDGTMWSWGTNAGGTLGASLASSARRSSPVQIGALTTWYQVDAGANHSAAVKTDGTLWVWGDGGSGALGTGNTINRSSPVQVGALTNWSQAAAGHSDNSAAVKTDGTLWTWGANDSGQNGDGTIVSKSSPVQVGALTNWSQVSSGSIFTCALTTNREWYGWGDGRAGEFGEEATASRSSPVQIGSLTSWLQVSAASNHTAALYGVT